MVLYGIGILSLLVRAVPLDAQYHVSFWPRCKSSKILSNDMPSLPRKPQIDPTPRYLKGYVFCYFSGSSEGSLLHTFVFVGQQFA